MRYAGIPVYLSLRHVLYALIIAVVVYIIRELRKYRRQVNPRRPDLTMKEAWQHWLAGIPKHPDKTLYELLPAPASSANASSRPPSRRCQEYFQGNSGWAPDDGGSAVSERVLADAWRDLLEIETLSHQADEERLLIRQAIIASATMELLLEAISQHDEQGRRALIQGYQQGMDQLLQDAITGSRLKWIVLREYARWRFDDAVTNDWFHQYVHLARPYIREKVRLAREHVLRTDAGAGRFAEIYDTLLAELREQVLAAPPKQRFVPPDLP